MLVNFVVLREWSEGSKGCRKSGTTFHNGQEDKWDGDTLKISSLFATSQIFFNVHSQIKDDQRSTQSGSGCVN